MKWTIGDVTVTKIVELEMTGGTRFLLPQATPRGDFADRLAAAAFRRRERPAAHEHPQLHRGNARPADHRRYLPGQ